MKVRWRADSLRLRVSPSELEALQAGEPVTETAAFPGGWTMTLRRGDRTRMFAEQPGALSLVLSEAALTELCLPEAEGVYFSEGSYRFFVEKDFPCAHPRPSAAQESSETFAPPPGFAERHKTV